MRLQTENRRQSVAPMTIDLSRAGVPSSFGSPQSSKRASFTPLTGTFAGSRPSLRTPSFTEGQELSSSPTPQATSFSASDLVIPNPPPNSSRRYSGLFGRSSPPQAEGGYADILTAEIQGLRKEMQVIRDELDNTKHELSESNEAREASETCVTALREFIAENNVGATQTAESSPISLKLPPPPTMTSGEEEDGGGKTSTATAGWGFKLWKDATTRTPTAPQSAVLPSPAPPPQTPMTATPLSRKIGGFFSGHRSTSSVASSSIHSPPPVTLPPLQTNAASSVRDSMYSFSDTSSMAEPISPPNEFDGNIIVRDVTSISELGSLEEAPSEFGKDVQQPRQAVPIV